MIAGSLPEPEATTGTAAQAVVKLHNHQPHTVPKAPRCSPGAYIRKYSWAPFHPSVAALYLDVDFDCMLMHGQKRREGLAGIQLEGLVRLFRASWHRPL